MKAVAVLRSATIAAALALCAGCTSMNYAPGTLGGTSWRIAAVNGTPTPAAGDYSMRFAPDGSFGARFGCNHVGGRYGLAGETLIFTNVAQTLMGCPEPAGTFESQGSAIIGQPMRMTFSGSQRLELSNQVGSIALVTAP